MQVGMDPVHYGGMLILNLGIGVLTPPVGSTLFIGSAIAKLRIEELAKALVPFYIIMGIVLLFITFVPELR